MDLDVPKLKCAYKLERDVYVVALAPSLNPLQNASKQLYVCTFTKH
jgi:hypothetical protein